MTRRFVEHEIIMGRVAAFEANGIIPAHARTGPSALREVSVEQDAVTT
jgi:hypothetical protein